MNPLRGEAEAETGGRTLSLVLDNGAWCAIEEVLDLSYLDILAKLATNEIAGRSPPNRIMRAILWGATRANHDDLTIDQCGDMLMRDPALHGPVSEVMIRSTRLLEPEESGTGDSEPGEAEPGKAPAKTRKSPIAG